MCGIEVVMTRSVYVMSGWGRSMTMAWVGSGRVKQRQSRILGLVMRA